MIDHRRLGRELDLFVSDPLAGAGLPIWLPAGAAARHAVEEYVRELERRSGHQHVYSPPLGKRELFELSGHLGYFADDMFPPMRLSADDEFVLRPASARTTRWSSGRGAAPTGSCRCGSPSWAGCTARSAPACSAGCPGSAPSRSTTRTPSARPSRSATEVVEILAADPRGARRARRPAGRVPAVAARAGREVRRRRRRSGPAPRSCSGRRWPGWTYVEAPGEAAFYGPKIDIQIVDAAGRESTISTIQLDFDKPERFDLSYTDSDGSRRRPVMVHRSLVGSMERLFAYLIEVHEGAFPAWYAPVQLVLLPVDDGQADAAADLARRAGDAGLRVEVDAAGSLGARVRDAARRRVPYLGVMGAREAADGHLALRLRGGRALAPMPADAALALIGGQVAARAADLLPSD